MKNIAMSPVGFAALALCVALTACDSKKQAVPPVTVDVAWLTDRAPAKRDEAKLRAELAEWFAPFLAPQPCGMRFYFRVSLKRNEGGKTNSIELFSQTQDDILKQTQGFMQTMFPPGRCPARC